MQSKVHAANMIVERLEYRKHLINRDFLFARFCLRHNQRNLSELALILMPLLMPHATATSFLSIRCHHPEEQL